MSLEKMLIERGLEGAVLMTGYDDCAVGVLERFGTPPIIIYDKDKVIAKLVEDGATYHEAEEYYEYNQLGGWHGERTPGFLIPFSLGDAEAIQSDTQQE